MCRMMAIIGGPELKRSALQAFQPQGRDGRVKPWESPGHLDGWGMAVYGARGPEYIGRSPQDIETEKPAYFAAAEQAVAHPSTLVLVHVRKSTCGVITRENTHPFCHDRWVFCHNGTVQAQERLGPRPETIGSSDSEELFRRWCAQGRDIAAYGDWIATVAQQCPHTSLTSFLSDGRRLAACRRFSLTPLHEVPPQYDAAEWLPHYYTLYHWRRGREHVLSSEVLPDLPGAWEPLAPNELRLVDIA